MVCELPGVIDFCSCNLEDVTVEIYKIPWGRANDKPKAFDLSQILFPLDCIVMSSGPPPTLISVSFF